MRPFNIPVLGLWLVALVPVVALAWFGSKLLLPDEWAVLTNGFGHEWVNDYATYRYVPFAMGKFIFEPLGIHRLDPTWLWCLLFVLGLGSCAYAFTKYLRLPDGATPVVFGLVGCSGLMFDRLEFPLAYINFGMGWFFTGLALIALSSLAAWRLPVAVVAVVLAMMSYQESPMAIVFAALLAAFRPNWRPHQTIEPLFVVFAAGILFLVSIKVFGPISPQKAISIVAVVENVPSYFGVIYRILAGRYAPGFPILEMLAYEFALLALVVISCVRGASRGPVSVIAPIVAFVIAILLLPGPLNLAVNDFWPVPRSFASDLFFFAGAVAVLFCDYLPKRIWPLGTALFLVAVVGLGWRQWTFVQADLVQSAQDQTAAKAILPVIAQSASGRVAVRSSWWTFPQLQPGSIFMDNRRSAFSTGWGTQSILTALAGRPVPLTSVPEGACTDPKASQFWVEIVEGTTVICMEPLNIPH